MINTASEFFLDEEPVEVTAYCLPDVEAKMVRVGDEYVVLQTDKVKRVAKGLYCISYLHADFVLEGCINNLRQMVQ